jgi:Cupin-like domain
MDGQMDQTAHPTEKTHPASDATRNLAASPPPKVVPQDGPAGAGSEDSRADQLDPAIQSQADDEWRSWIAENLMIGVPVPWIMESMISKGRTSEEAGHELKAAQDSPYVRGAELLRNRLAKRDWLLTVYRKNKRLHPDSAAIDKRHRLSRLELLRDYYSTNQAVIISGMMDDWPAMRKWNLDYFARTFGERQLDLRVARPANTNHDEIQHQPFVGKIRFGDFVEQTCTDGETTYLDLTAHHASANRKALGALWDDFLPIPEYLATDRPDGILWMAPRGISTPFQHNLTNTLVAQAHGCTRVKITPTWDMPLMYNNFCWFSDVDGRVVPAETRPPGNMPQIHELILNPGEVLFLPVGWLLHVEAIDFAVTVTFANFVFDNDFASFYSTYGAV